MRVPIAALVLWVAAAQQAATPQVFAPPPQYPGTLHDVEGKVDASYVVGTDGVVRDIKILKKKPNPAFVDATVAALQQWRLKPLIKDGVPREQRVTRTFFFTPPDGFLLVLGVHGSLNGRVHEGSGKVSIASGSEWLLSLPMFSDFELTGEVRVPEGSVASLLIRAWPDESEQKTSGDEAYRVALGADPKRPVGSITGEALKVTTKSYDAEAAEAYRGAMTSWQPMRVECLDRGLRVFLGGRLVTEAELIDGFVGHLGLEVEKGSIDVRNLGVRRQDRYRDNVPLGGLYPGAYAIEKELGITPPTLQQAPRPSYTRKAMGDKTQGVVALEAIVERDGSVGAVKVVRSLSDELDASGVRTVKRWHFAPATMHGEAVACIVDIELSFTLR